MPHLKEAITHQKLWKTQKFSCFGLKAKKKIFSIAHSNIKFEEINKKEKTHQKWSFGMFLSWK